MIVNIISLFLLKSIFEVSPIFSPDISQIQVEKEKKIEKIVYKKSFGDEPEAVISIAIECLAETKNNSMAEAINSHIAEIVWNNYQRYYHNGDIITQVPKRVREVTDYIAKEFESSVTSCETDKEEALYPAHRLELSGCFNYTTKNYYSYRYSAFYEDDKLAARPAYYESGLVIDRRDGKALALADFIRPEANDELGRLLARAFKTQVTDERTSYDRIEPSPNFAFSDTGVIFIYDAGEIASLSQSVVCLELSWADISPYLRISLE